MKFFTSHRHLLIRAMPAIPFVVAFLIYIPSLYSEFVWDDLMIIKNDEVTKPGTSLFTWLKTPVLDLFTPFRNLNVGAARLIFGDNPFFFSLTGILVHAFTAALGYILLFRVWRRMDTAIIGSLLFAVHPVCTDRIAFISSAWFAMHVPFMLAAILLSESDKPVKRLLSVLFGISAIFTYEQAITLPVLLFLWHFTVAGSEMKKSCTKSAPFFVIALIYIVLRTVILGGVARYGADYYGGSLFAFIPLFFTLIAYGQWLCLVPFPLLADYTGYFHVPDTVNWLRFFLALIACLAMIMWLYRLYRINRRTLFVAMAGPLSWLPASNIIPTNTIFAERHLYIWVLCTCGLLAFALSHYHKEPSHYKCTEIMILCAIFLALSMSTLHRQSVWQNELILFSVSTRDNPRSAHAWLSLSGAQINAGMNEEALESLHRSSMLGYRPIEYYWNLGSALFNTGNADKAADALKKGISIGGGHEFHRNLALCYAAMGKREKALAEAKEYRITGSGQSYDEIIRIIELLLKRSGSE